MQTISPLLRPWRSLKCRTPGRQLPMRLQQLLQRLRLKTLSRSSRGLDCRLARRRAWRGLASQNGVRPQAAPVRACGTRFPHRGPEIPGAVSILGGRVTGRMLETSLMSMIASGHALNVLVETPSTRPRWRAGDDWTSSCLSFETTETAATVTRCCHSNETCEMVALRRLQLLLQLCSRISPLLGTAILCTPHNHSMGHQALRLRSSPRSLLQRPGTSR